MTTEDMERVNVNAQRSTLNFGGHGPAIVLPLHVEWRTLHVSAGAGSFPLTGRPPVPRYVGFFRLSESSGTAFAFLKNRPALTAFQGFSHAK